MNTQRTLTIVYSCLRIFLNKLRSVEGIFQLLNTLCHSFIQAIFIVPLQVYYYSEALPTQHGFCVGFSRRTATGNCEWRTCPRSPRPTLLSSL